MGAMKIPEKLEIPQNVTIYSPSSYGNLKFSHQFMGITNSLMSTKHISQFSNNYKRKITSKK